MPALQIEEGLSSPAMQSVGAGMPATGITYLASPPSSDFSYKQKRRFPLPLQRRIRQSAAMKPNTQRSGEHRLRHGRVSESGRIYLITTVVAGRRALFCDAIRASTAATLIDDAATWPNAHLYAWVLMPDHLHCVLQLRGHTDISRTVGSAKARISRTLAHRGLIQLPLWQRGYHDRALRFDDDLTDTVRYVIENPLRAGIVGQLGEYPWWGAAWLDRRGTASRSPQR
jgi:REP element-mobilizing transposase RayT